MLVKGIVCKIFYIVIFYNTYHLNLSILGTIYLPRHDNFLKHNVAFNTISIFTATLLLIITKYKRNSL